jgi:tellurite resistance protein TerC
MLKYARRIVVFVVGMTVLLIGVAMIVLPGPAVVVIPVGLAILATEYAWARRWLRVVQDSAEKGAEKLNIRSPFLRNILRKKGQNDQDNTPKP